MAVFIDGVEIMNPSDRKVIMFDIEQEDRTASGRLVSDYVATKRILQLSWSIIKHDDLKQILDILTSRRYHTIIYPDPQNGETHTITAKVSGNIQIGSWRVIGGVRYWKDVSLSLVEQ